MKDEFSIPRRVPDLASSIRRAVACKNVSESSKRPEEIVLPCLEWVRNKETPNCCDRDEGLRELSDDFEGANGLSPPRLE